MSYENLQKKYGVTEDDIRQGIAVITKDISKICNINVLFAVADLLIHGDVSE